jgi:predicted Zn finger-like uncharacterized protein
MPEIVSCPDCDRKLRVPDNLLGKKVKCPQCGTMFTADANGAAPSGRNSSIRLEDDEEEAPRKRRRDDDDEDEPPRKRRRDDDDDNDEPRSRRRRDDDDDDEPRGRRRRDDDYDEPEEKGGRAAKEGWKKVRTGTLLYVIGIWVAIGAFVVRLLGQGFMLVGFMSAVSGAVVTGSVAGLTGLGYGMMILAGLTLLLEFGSNTLVTLGSGFNLAIPPKRDWGLKGMALATFICYAVAFGCYTLANIMLLIQLGSFGLASFVGVGATSSMGVGMGALHTGLMVIGSLSNLAAVILAVFFYRLVALRFNQKDLARSLLNNFIFWCCYVAGSIVLVCLLALLAGTMLANLGISTASGSTSVASASSTAGAMAYVGCAFMFILMGIGIGLASWYAVLVTQVRDAVTRNMRKMG